VDLLVALPGQALGVGARRAQRHEDRSRQQQAEQRRPPDAWWGEVWCAEAHPAIALPGARPDPLRGLGHALEVVAEREKVTIGRLRYWLHLSQAPKCRTGFTASKGEARWPRNVMLCTLSCLGRERAHYPLTRNLHGAGVAGPVGAVRRARRAPAARAVSMAGRASRQPRRTRTR